MTDDRPVREETATLDGRPTAVDAEAGVGPHSATDDARYSVLGRLGKGGMGEVMLVRDKRTGREVAPQTDPSRQTERAHARAILCARRRCKVDSSTRRSCRSTISTTMLVGSRSSR